MIAHLLLVPKSFAEHVNILKRLFSFFGNTLRVDRDLKQRRRRRQRELQKNNILGLDWPKKKKQICTCVTLFCTLLCRHCSTTTWKFLISRFVEDVNNGQRLSFSFPELWYSLLQFNSRKKNCQHLTNWTRWNNHDRFSGARRHFLSVVFVVIVFVFA